MAGKGKHPYTPFVFAIDASDSVDGVWDLYLATNSLDDNPKKRNDNRVNNGIRAANRIFPLPSPSAGQTVGEATKRLTVRRPR